jgi:hypothetical protein
MKIVVIERGPEAVPASPNSGVFEDWLAQFAAQAA